jgi:hypothetical protein
MENRNKINQENSFMSGMLACLKPHPLGCARIPEHPKNNVPPHPKRCGLWQAIVFLISILTSKKGEY